MDGTTQASSGTDQQHFPDLGGTAMIAAPCGLRAGLDQLSAEQLNSGFERGSYSEVSASDLKLTSDIEQCIS